MLIQMMCHALGDFLEFGVDNPTGNFAAQIVQRLVRGGRYIHHIPEDEREHDPRLPGMDAAMRARTVGAITAAGYDVDPAFWPELGAADCTQCHAGCHDSPSNG
ncbi:hypothetical protein AB0B31_14245 [Catellatospora citrea]|uniref:hypothetical protein n=1 Tax=Catellatospora citrea TaxID=53366 RepID=UPI00340D1509